jgi:hypothetical protein
LRADRRDRRLDRRHERQDRQRIHH